MATGGPSDSNAKIDLKTFWPEKDIRFMASMLRGTGKFHVVPIYETQDELTYEEEEDETQCTSLAMDTTTPKSYSGQAKNYRAVKPPTPKKAPTQLVCLHPRPQTPHMNPTYDRVDPTHIPPQPDMGLPSMKFAPHPKPPSSYQTMTYPSVPSPYSASMLNSTALASMRAPQLPPFSGESQKGDVSFEVWKYELFCAINDVIYPNALIIQSVRISLKGRARDILLAMEALLFPQTFLTNLRVYMVLCLQDRFYYNNFTWKHNMTMNLLLTTVLGLKIC